jgi:hypothetical protein
MRRELYHHHAHFPKCKLPLSIYCGFFPGLKASQISKFGKPEFYRQELTAQTCWCSFALHTHPSEHHVALYVHGGVMGVPGEFQTGAKGSRLLPMNHVALNDVLLFQGWHLLICKVRTLDIFTKYKFLASAICREPK